MDEENAMVISLIRQMYGQDLSVYEDSYLNNIIQTRIKATHCLTFENYAKRLRTHNEELAKLIDQLSNSYSEFFRNPLTFNYIEQVVLPEIVESKKSAQEKEIRIWSAACATGQEPYSIAVLCDEIAAARKLYSSFRIFATDVSHENIRLAKEGVYQPANLSQVTLKRVKNYFKSNGDAYTISAPIKNQVDFSAFDLLSESESSPPASIYGNFDLIFCCNLLFYYKLEYQKKILDKIRHCLNRGGYLITGDSEREVAQAHGFKEIFQYAAIFSKN